MEGSARKKKLTKKEIEYYKRALEIYEQSPLDFVELPPADRQDLVKNWDELGLYIHPVLNNIIEGIAIGTASGKSKICMPKSDYLAEHKHLNYLLSHPTQSGLKKEFAKQTKEVAMRGGSYALHAVIVHKPYPLEKAYQEAMSIMKITKPKFMRETQQSYRFRNIPKTKFQSKSFRTKIINPNISLVFGNLK